MSEYAILSVIYHEGEEHYNMFKKAIHSFPENVEQLLVVNRLLENKDYNLENTILNDENCLAKAWNIGLKKLFKDYGYVVVSGLDSISPSAEDIEEMISILKAHPEYGIISATPTKMHNTEEQGLIGMKHGDGSFSFYVISRETYEKVGDFDENYKPAYFEDNDYIERLYTSGFEPKRHSGVVYHHVMQGTVKFAPELSQKYPEFMQKNLDYFRKKFNKVPDHLPHDIVFKV